LASGAIPFGDFPLIVGGLLTLQVRCRRENAVSQ
jgi:hypothetical protein